MRVAKSRLKQIISEELRALKRESLDDQGAQEHSPVGSYGLDTNLMDPHAGDPDALFNNVQVASRILEDIPMDIVPEEVKMAAENLRVALDNMADPNPVLNNA